MLLYKGTTYVTLAFYCLLRLCCVHTQYGRFLFYCKGGDSDVLIPVITSGTYEIKNHSIPSWYVVSLLWWYAKRRYSNAPYRGIKNHDELKGRFTVWLEKVVRNAKINYIKRLKRQPPTLYLEEIPESALPAQNIAADVYTKSEFEFEEERLAEAFSKLPLMRKRILTMLFVENISPDEISKKLNCSPQYVYNQRYKALKALRNELDKDGEQS